MIGVILKHAGPIVLQLAQVCNDVKKSFIQQCLGLKITLGTQFEATKKAHISNHMSIGQTNQAHAIILGRRNGQGFISISGVPSALCPEQIGISK